MTLAHGSDDDVDLRRPMYFMPGELVFVVDHQPAVVRDGRKLIKAALNVRERPDDEPGTFIPTVLNGQAIPETLDRIVQDPDFNSRRISVVTFEPSQTNEHFPMRQVPQAFSLLFLDVRDMYGPPLTSENYTHDELTAFSTDIVALNQIVGRSSIEVSDDPVVRAVSPNWLTTPFHQHAGGGSPGAWPANADITVSATTGTFTLVSPPPALSAAVITDPPINVEVVILDTAPPCKQIIDAYDLHNGSNFLLEDLVGPNARCEDGQLVDAGIKIVYAPEGNITLPDLNDFHVPEHDYDMSDHGLFIAGIVRTLARTVDIRVIEVLNKYGIGSLGSIARGFEILLKERQGSEGQKDKRLIINCSLGITMPLPDHPHLGLEDAQLLAAEQEVRRLTLALESITASTDNNVLVVAASGNDGTATDLLHARYPAAFESVIGVGAIDEQDQATAYTNASDRPDGTGYATFGGATNAGKANDAGGGILGVYTGLIPDAAGGDPQLTSHGWAWWAGTSFAAPIISALVADGAVRSPATTVQVEAALAGAFPNPHPKLGRIIGVRQLP